MTLLSQIMAGKADIVTKHFGASTVTLTPDGVQFGVGFSIDAAAQAVTWLIEAGLPVTGHVRSADKIAADMTAMGFTPEPACTERIKYSHIIQSGQRLYRCVMGGACCGSPTCTELIGRAVNDYLSEPIEVEYVPVSTPG